MIKLKLIGKPIELTKEKEEELIREYIISGKPVWKQEYISEALLRMSNGKCAYSEQKLNTESAYMEIEHFRNKDKYPHLVVNWGNLLPSCKKCNATKGILDVLDEPIVNPLEDFPREHLYVKAFRFYGKDIKGQNTISAVALNDRAHFVSSRSLIGFKISDMLEGYYEALINTTGDRAKRNFVNRIKSVLKDCGPLNEYSAVISTYILYEFDTYKLLKDFMQMNKLWDCELEQIEKDLKSIALPPPESKT